MGSALPPVYKQVFVDYVGAVVLQYSHQHALFSNLQSQYLCSSIAPVCYMVVCIKRDMKRHKFLYSQHFDRDLLARHVFIMGVT